MPDCAERAHTRSLTMGSNGNGNGPPELVAYGSAARCLARALVAAFDACDDSEVPLSQLQRVAILEAALLEFDGFGMHLSSLAAVSRLLADIRLAGPSGS
jgi:hypothetical protein